MGIGMITVFLVLCLVVLAGNFLIWFINRFAPTEPLSGSQHGHHREASDPGQLSPKEIAAITSAVFHVTGGKGKIEKIERK